MPPIVLPTQNPLISAPFVDPDEPSYGETPVEKQFELRAANATPGAGALVEQRNSTSYIVEAERVGERLNAADATAGWTGTGLGTTVTNPTGYGGNSLSWSPGSLANGASAAAYFALDPATGSRLLSEYSGGALSRIWARLSAAVASQTLRIRYEKVGSWQADYTLGVLTDAYQEPSVAKQAALAASSGTPWSSAPDRISIVVVNGSGASQSPVIFLRDLRVGTVQTAKTVPDGHLAWESSYDFRVRYRDAASPATTFGPWSGWSTIKVSQPPTVTATGPAAAATVNDPTPAYTWTFVSPGGKAQASAFVSLYEVVGGQDQFIGTYALTGAGTSITQPAFVLAHGKTYAWTLTATDTEGLSTTTPRRTFTTSFAQPAAPTGVSATPDRDTSSVAVAWTNAPPAYFQEWRVYRRPSGGAITRIGVNGKTWQAGDAAITGPSLVDYHVPEGVQVEYLVSAHSGSASSEGESATTSTTAELLAGRWMNVVPGVLDQTFEIVPEDFTETPELQIEETEAIDRPTLHTSLGQLLEPRLSFTLFVSADDLGTIAKLRAISIDPGLEYSLIKSPHGDVWRVQYGTIPRAYVRSGNSRTSVSAVVVAS